MEQSIKELEDSTVRQHLDYILHTNEYIVNDIVRTKSDRYEHINVFITTNKKRTIDLNFSMHRSNGRLQNVNISQYGVEITTAIDDSIINIYINYKYAKERIECLKERKSQ